MFGVLHLLAQVLDGADQKAAGAGGRVQQLFAQAGVDHIHHELGDGAGGVELARVARALQVFEDFFVQVVELVTLALAVEVDGVQLIDDLAQQVAAFHVVVGVFKHAAHHVAARVAPGIPAQILERAKEIVVDKAEQAVAGEAFRVCGPVAPAQRLGDGALVAVAGELQLFFQRVKHFKEQKPGELGDALGVTIDAAVLAHHVLDGFDDAGEVGHVVLGFMNEMGL